MRLFAPLVLALLAAIFFSVIVSASPGLVSCGCYNPSTGQTYGTIKLEQQTPNTAKYTLLPGQSQEFYTPFGYTGSFSQSWDTGRWEEVGRYGEVDVHVEPSAAYYGTYATVRWINVNVQYYRVSLTSPVLNGYSFGDVNTSYTSYPGTAVFGGSTEYIALWKGPETTLNGGGTQAISWTGPVVRAGGASGSFSGWGGVSVVLYSGSATATASRDLGEPSRPL